MTHPSTPRVPLVEELAGHRVPDPYRWLEDDADARTRHFLAEQDAFFRKARRNWPDRAAWRQAVVDRTQPEPPTLPLLRGGRQFQLTQPADSSAPVLRITDTDTGQWSALPLGTLATPGGTVRGFRPSWEGARLMCMVSFGGSDSVLLHAIETDTGALLERPLGPVPAAWVAWLPGGEAFYYVAPASSEDTSTDGAAGPRTVDLRVRLHHLGTDPAIDPVVFGDGRHPGGYYGLTIDPDGRWLAVTASQGAAGHNSLWTAALRDTTSAPEWQRVTDDAFDAAVSPRFGPDGRLYLMTDHDAPRGRICVAEPDRPQPEHWREFVAEDPEAVLDDCVLLEDTDPAVGADGEPLALVLRTRHGASELTAHGRRHGTRPALAELPGTGLVSGLRADPKGGAEAWLVYSDFVTPDVICRYDCRTHSLTRCVPAADQREPAPGTHPASSSPVRSRLVNYPARDGTTVRMFVLSPADGPGGPRPTIVSGYGGFGVPTRPMYSPVIHAWVAAGGRYALACVRGGGEEGKAWHDAGRREHKGVAIDDFLAATEWLVDQELTEPGMLASAGASHGGFLVAAAAMRRPDLYAAVLCSDPLLDLVRYERLGVGATWTEEFGSAGDPRELANLLRISPYHQVRTGTAYPAVLFSGGTQDPRLDAAHVRKMCAALQYATTSPDAVLLRHEPGVGHGTRDRESTLELNADTLSFLATHTTLRAPAPSADQGPARAFPEQLGTKTLKWVKNQ